MKNILYFCSTYYQLLTFTCLKATKHKNDLVILIIFDTCKEAELVADRLKKENFFSDVKYVPFPHASKLKNLKNCIFGLDFCELGKDAWIDEIYSFNFQAEIHWEFNFLLKKNKNITTHRIEEGILSYFTNFDKPNVLRVSYFIRKLLNKKNMRSICKDFYCFKPELYNGKLTPVKIDTISQENIKQIFASVFNVFEPIYSNKIIYLGSIYGVEGGRSIDELPVINSLIEHYGSNNVVLKVHPRDNIDKYNKLKCIIDTSSSYAPIEILYFCGFYEKCTFFSAFSGALLNLSSINDDLVSYYLTKLINSEGNSLAEFYGNKILEFEGILKNLVYLNKID